MTQYNQDVNKNKQVSENQHILFLFYNKQKYTILNLNFDMDSINILYSNIYHWM